eukprot:CAMPEP_0185191432 /NCGR_PEP_ID=MMETSP1140-20130426/15492_1 /TAXON_ID=298111 /ORGANISM="Pavlova sp., Strain CCMP459" /LENGTH=77 /DNA_ID=CAMNT_0027758135 /DNA_START=129 /DNA_END=359 /DNA_ORIENTATION=-
MIRSRRLLAEKRCRQGRRTCAEAAWRARFAQWTFHHRQSPAAAMHKGIKHPMPISCETTNKLELRPTGRQCLLHTST